MKFVRPNGGIIYISSDPLEELLSFRQLENSTPESGGMILGRIIRDSNDVVIDEITTPDKADKKSRFSFFRRRENAQRQVKKAWSKSKGTCLYLGEWHTHPEDVPSPSTTVDIPNWNRIAERAIYEQDFLVFLIVGRMHSNMWELCKNSDRISLLKPLDSNT
ncbi:MAG: Mov34/MPN/PAD-1 family protein [Pyrinomonadaceae bacterium]